MIGKKPDNKQGSLNADIKDKLVNIKSKTVLLFIPIFNTGYANELLKFIILLKNTLKGQNLTTVPQIYAMIKYLLTGESF